MLDPPAVFSSSRLPLSRRRRSSVAQRPFGLWAINAGYQTRTFTVMGVILGAWH